MGSVVFTNKQTYKQSINIDYYYCKNSPGCHEISVKARSCFSDYHLSFESLTSVKDIVVWACCPPWNWKLKISSKGFENPELEPRPPNPLENSPKKLIKNKCSYFRFFRQELRVPVAEFKEFERRFKFKPRLKYGWFHIKCFKI